MSDDNLDLEAIRKYAEAVLRDGSSAPLFWDRVHQVIGVDFPRVLAELATERAIRAEALVPRPLGLLDVPDSVAMSDRPHSGR